MMQVATQIAIALLGCWEPVTGGRFGEVTCVTMGAEALHLKVVTIVPGAATRESVLRLDGTRQPVDADGCTGWEEARASSDGERIVVNAEVTCGDSPKQRRSAVLMLTSAGEWLHAEASGIAVIGNAQIQLLRPVSAYLTLPADIRSAVLAVQAEAEVAREELKRSKAKAADLLELERMGAADDVIDVVVAASNPASFVLGVGGRTITEVADDETATRHLLRAPMPAYFGFGYPGFYYSDLAFLYGCSSLYSSRAYYADPRFCSAYSYYGYNYWQQYRGGYWPGVLPMGPVVIRPTSPPASGGRVVRGTGYSNTGSSSGGTRTASPRSSGSSGGSASGSASSGGSRSGGTASGSSSSGGRTAQPRKP